MNREFKIARSHQVNHQVVKALKWITRLIHLKDKSKDGYACWWGGGGGGGLTSPEQRWVGRDGPDRRPAAPCRYNPQPAVPDIEVPQQTQPPSLTNKHSLPTYLPATSSPVSVTSAATGDHRIDTDTDTASPSPSPATMAAAASTRRDRAASSPATWPARVSQSVSAISSNWCHCPHWAMCVHVQNRHLPLNNPRHSANARGRMYH